MQSIYEHLDELYNLHHACQTLEHGIKDSNREWQLFWPSSFVYSYFTFNSIYTTDWSESVKEDRLLEWTPTFIDDGGQEQKVGESKKMRGLLKFAYGVLDQEAAEIYSGYLRDKLSGVKNPEAELQHMYPDRETKNDADKFRTNFSKVFKGEQMTTAQHRDAVEVLLRFVYKVRCNVFHGRKTTVQMMEGKQRIRLRIYAAIIEAANELFFYAMEKKMEWQRPVYALERRTGSRRKPIDPVTVTAINNRRITRKFDVQIPPGALFYPCCGNDSLEPLLLFLQTPINEFHFADIEFIPPIPGIISGRTPSAMLLFCANEAPVKDIYRVENESLGTIIIPHKEQQHELDIGLQQGKTRIFCHQLDGSLTLRYKIQTDLAVFYYRGDSMGEGGSGQWWLGHELFNEVLSHLVDGGLILTDGSNHHPYQADLPWSFLWQAEDLLSNGTESEELDFTYAERSFRYLGQCGRRGPVFAWQVNRIEPV